MTQPILTGFEVRYSTTDHRYHATLHGVEVGAGWTYIEAEAAAQAPYAVLTDAAGDPPVDIPDEPDDAPPGGDEPPDIWFARQWAADCAAAHALGSGPPVWWELLAAAPTPPAPSPLPSAAGGDAASAAGPNRYRAHGCVVTWYGGRAADFRVRLVKRCDTPERARRIAATLNAFHSGPTAKAVAS